MPQNALDEKSTLAQIMDWCHQATSHYLSQCWPSSMSPYGVTIQRWLNPYWTEFILKKENFTWSFSTLRWTRYTKQGLLKHTLSAPGLLMTWWHKDMKASAAMILPNYPRIYPELAPLGLNCGATISIRASKINMTSIHVFITIYNPHCPWS